MGNKVYNILALISIILTIPGFALITGIPPYNIIRYALFTYCLFTLLILVDPKSSAMDYITDGKDSKH